MLQDKRSILEQFNILIMRSDIASLKFLAVFLFLSFSVCAQTNIELILKNSSSRHLDTVDAFDLSQKEFYRYDYKDTLQVHFDKNNIDCYNIRYHEKDKMFREQIWLDTGQIRIEAHIDSNKLVIDTVVNSPTYYMVKDFAKTYSELYKTNDTAALNKYLLLRYEQNIGNPFSLMVGNYYLGINQNSKSDLIKLRALTEKQGDKFSWFFIYPMVIDRMNTILAINKIDLSKFTFINLKNKKVKLSLQGSDNYVLDFWFLACPPCIRDHKEINATYKKFTQHSVQIISISTDENVAQWKSYLLMHKYGWENYLQTGSPAITDQLSLHSFPAYIVVNKQGDIVDTYSLFTDVKKRFHIDD